MFDFKKIFQKEPAPVRIRAQRAMQVMDATKQMVPVVPGDELLVHHSAIAGLDASDCAVLDNGPKKKYIDPSPARPTPKPAPEAWKSLPACFTEWHDITECFRVAREHKELITKKRIEIFGTATQLLSSGTTRRIIVNHFQDPRPGENLVLSRNEIDLEDPEVKFNDRCLTNAMDAAEDYLERLTEELSLKRQKLHLDCGYERISNSEKLQALVTRVRKVGLEIFSLRLASLELAPQKVVQLFAGSGLFVKYHMIDNAYSGPTFFTGPNENGENGTYSEDPVASSACIFISETERIKAVSELLATAEAELAKAVKASKSAA